MNRFFYSRLAAINIKKNAKLYIPYILTCICTVVMFYILMSISLNTGLSKIHESVVVIMRLGCIVVGIFSAVILLYTNSFLIKRRKKELGLFNILGMEKKHIAKVMSLENLYVAVLALLIGLPTGILFSKLMLLLLFKLLKFNVPVAFEIPLLAVGLTALLFAFIFTITLLRNLGQVQLSKPIELLHGGNTGEKEPKTKWLLTLIGLLTLGAGYTIAIVTKSPLDALGLFFVAVILVIIGTYCLFTAGSIAWLKALRKNKTYYYKTKHFTSVSGMLYRMKQNAVGLANICILSTMVLVILSSTTSLYFGMEDALRKQYPRNIEVEASGISQQDVQKLEQMLDSKLAEEKITVESHVKYRYKRFNAVPDGSFFTFDHDGNYINESVPVFFIPLDQYNRLQNTDIKLSAYELLFYSPNADYTQDTVRFGDLTYKVKSKLNSLNVEKYNSINLNDVYYFIVPNEQAVKDIFDQMTQGSVQWNGLSYYYGFDMKNSTGEEQIRLEKYLDEVAKKAVKDDSSEENISLFVTSAESNRINFLSMYGGLFFLGIFLGALFLMATVLIMYYKQISEGYDDKSRFEIMQKVGMSQDVVKKTIRSQVLMVFFLPIAVAGVHILAAFKMLVRLLSVLNLTNEGLFALCTAGTILVFALFYAVIYTLTAKVYYRIVE